MALVVFQLEIFVPKIKNAFYTGVQLHGGKRERLAGELEVHLLKVVVVDVHVAEGVDELAGLQGADLRHHHGEQGIGSNVEGDTQEYVGAALVKLAAEFAIGYIKLKKGMTGHQGHLRKLAYIPGADDHAAAVGITLDLVQHLADLVDGLAIGLPASPLLAVYRSQVAVLISPFVPDAHAILLQVGGIGIAPEEPQQLVDDAFKMQLFGGYEGKALLEVKAHLVAECAEGACAGAVRFGNAGVQYMPK